MTVRRRPWPAELKMPMLVDGQLTLDDLRLALRVARKDGGQLTLDEGLEWLELNVRQPPHPPSPSKPPGTRGRRTRQRYATPAGRPGRLIRSEARQAA